MLFCARKCTWHPFLCYMGLDGFGSATRSIWLFRVPSKPISHSNGCHMHIISLMTNITDVKNITRLLHTAQLYTNGAYNIVRTVDSCVRLRDPLESFEKSVTNLSIM